MDVEPVILEPGEGQPTDLLDRRRSQPDDGPLDYPVWITRNGDGYRILWQTPREGQPNEPRPAMLVKETESEWQLSLRLWTRFEAPSPLEKGLIIAHLRDRGVETEQILLAMDQFLELPRSEEWLDCYAQFPDLPEPIQRAIHEGEIDPRHIRFINRMPDSFGTKFLRGLENQTTALSVQQTRKLMESLRRLEESEVERLESTLDGISSATGDESPRERGKRILDQAQEIAYPRTTQRREAFDETLDELDLSGQIHVQPPNNFEGDYLDFRIRCRRDQSLDELAEELKRCQPLLDYV